MKIIFLGTGTSHGVPVIGCDCPVCSSANPKNQRTRSSIWIQVDDVSLLIDTANEFRIQALYSGIKHVDGVLYTHCHADHVFGFDDLRIFSQRSGDDLCIYGNQPTMDEICQVFSYVFRRTQKGGGKPQINPIVVDDPFAIQGVCVTPVPIYHGVLPINGYRIGAFAYVTDCSEIPKSSMELLYNLDVLVLGVIRRRPHATHMHVDQALTLIDELKPKRTYFTHISHYLEHDQLNAQLPPGVKLAYDGLEIQV